jgi:chromosome segregation ATPase
VRIDIHHFEPRSSVSRTLEQILTQLEALMARATDLDAKLDRINTATNNIAEDIRNLKGQIGTGMTQAEVDAVNDRLETTATALEAIAVATPDVPPTP